MIPFEDVCLVLTREPFGLTIPEIAALDDEQIRLVYWRTDPRDDRRNDEEGDFEAEHPYDVFRSVWTSRGLTDEEVVARWRADYPGDPIPGLDDDNPPTRPDEEE